MVAPRQLDLSWMEPAKPATKAPRVVADPFLHPCVTCGEPGLFGFGVKVRIGQLGTWFCAAHLPRAGALALEEHFRSAGFQ